MKKIVFVKYVNTLVKTVAMLVPVVLVLIAIKEIQIVLVLQVTMMIIPNVKSVIINVLLVIKMPHSVLDVLILIESNQILVNVFQDIGIMVQKLAKNVNTLVKIVQTKTHVLLVSII